MYEGTPSFVADRLTALFDKKSWKKEILRIEDEIERLGFDQFSNFAFDAEYFDLPTTELIPATADIFFCISEYYFEDEELIALQYLWKAIVSGLDQHLNQTAWKALWELTDDLLIEASRSGHIIHKNTINQVVDIQVRGFLPLTNQIRDHVIWYGPRFLFPWNVSKEVLKIENTTDEPFGLRVEAALYVAAWILRFEEILQPVPKDKMTLKSVNRYLAHHIAAFEDLDTFENSEIDDLNGYLPKDEVFNFSGYFSAALNTMAREYGREDNRFIKWYCENLE